MKQRSWTVVLSFTAVSVIVTHTKLLAQVVSDNSIGTIVTPNGNIFNITGGTTVGGRNLFHSFEQLSVPTQGVANFLNDPNVVNIFSRVTGGRVSEIDGVLRSRGKANFFLLNPSGITFGQNASLDVGGSFVATTANSIQFGDRGVFNVDNSNPVSPLLTVNPSAFLFNQIPIGQIINNSTAPTEFTSPSGIPISGLRVPNGQSLLLLGGDIIMDGGRLNALGGRIELGGLAEAGSTGLHSENNIWSLIFPQDSSFANINLAKDSRIAVRGSGGGDIFVNANILTATDGGRLVAGTEGRGNGGNITVNINELNINGIGNSGIGSGLAQQVISGASGNAGDILINARVFKASSGANLINNVLLQGNGNAGNITINADSILFSNRAVINAETYGKGNSANIVISARNHFTLESSSAISNSVVTIGNVNAGNIAIDAKRLIVRDISFIASNVNVGAIGNAGNLIIRSEQFIVQNGSQVASASLGSGNAGDLSIHASELIEVDGGFATDTGLFTQVGGQVGTSAEGVIGNLTVETDRLILRNGGQINATLFGTSRGSNSTLTVRASDIQLIGTTAIPGRTGIQPSVIQTRIEPFGRGEAPDLFIETNRLSIREGARIAADIEEGGRGEAGDILIRATDSVQISGVSSTFPTQPSLITTSINQGTEGKAGNLTIEAERLSIQNGAQISARSQGQGNAGNILLNIRDLLQADDGTISTAAAQSSGGAIEMTAKDIRLRGDSDITTSIVKGIGGSITLTANSILAFGDSDILAFARDGQGGNITLNTRAFFGQNYRPDIAGTSPETLDNNDRVDINASGAISETITLPFQNSLNQLSQNSIDTNALLANSCIARNSQNGTFYLTGTGGLPTNPGDLSTYPTGTIQPTHSQTVQKPGDAIVTQSNQIVEPQGVYQLPNGNLVLSRECS